MITLDYQKPAPGKASEYVKLEREMWKPLHQDRVNNGKIISWKLYAVSYPNGAGQEYDYVTMTEFSSFADLENPWAGTNRAAILGEAKYREVQTQTPLVRTMKRSDTIALLLATDGWSTAKNAVLSVHYLHSLPGKSGDLMKSQREYFQVSNNELVKAGLAAGWAAAAVRFPSLPDVPYDYISFNAYESLSQMDRDAPKEWRDKWLGARSAENNTLLNASRTRYKGELWRLVDQTVPRQQVTSRN